MLNLSQVLQSKGAEYAPFDPMRAHRIYAGIASKCGFKEHFDTKCKVIHIIGTNGKGSTGRFITMGLEQQGKSVLHFSSPHIFRFNERYYLSNASHKGEVDDAVLEAAHQLLWCMECTHEASYFEYATFLALILAKECEYLVLESGVGGEFDSTHILRADVSVFTLIGLDHQEMLGESVREIALTKLRAMDTRAIIARQNEREVENLAQEIAKQKGIACDLWQELDTDEAFKEQRDAFRDYVRTYHLPRFLCDNLHNAMRTLAVFGMKFDFKNLGELTLRGRCEVLAPHIVLDVGHNLDGARVLKEQFIEKQVNLVYNSYVEKDIEAILRELLPIIKKVLIISVENYRICPRERLIDILTKLGIVYEDFNIHILSQNESYLVFGSFSVVQKFLQEYKESKCKTN
ncbi:Mur ligase family protein [Helicobacter sp. MIT 21-1697]|uniref:Mur ligase family protein n=1 Tax=Helicobacter sp. MIT 21-1697 TaxID=2993733 RepID=UPI00224B55B0|nr:Mur ligase family protein [Helicobacter sp. MIT 21-1697]MCX2716389.1 Mur ligase family protein [Helicobacter sp. MIT 21-1697]